MVIPLSAPIEIDALLVPLPVWTNTLVALGRAFVLVSVSGCLHPGLPG